MLISAMQVLRQHGMAFWQLVLLLVRKFLLTLLHAVQQGGHKGLLLVGHYCIPIQQALPVE